jgi:hypothetical protein
MSALAPLRAPGSPRTGRAEPPALRLVVTRPLRVGRVSFAVLVGAVLAIGLVALLMLHTLAAQDAFRAQAMQARLSSLTDRVDQLSVAQSRLESPEQLAAQARALGMRPTGSIGFVRPGRHGRTIGVVAAPAPPPVEPTPAPSASSGPTRTGSKSGQTGQTDTGHRRASTAKHA